MKSYRKRFRYRARKRFYAFLQQMRISNIYKILRQKRSLLFIGTASAAIVVVIAIVSTNTVTAANAMAAASGSLGGGENNTVMADSIPSAAAVSSSATPEPTPTPTSDPTLKQGDQNEQVQQLQERLMELGYLDIDESTQLYGPATEYAVELFERQHSMEQDGVAGPEVLDLIYSQEAKHYTLLQGTSGNDVDSLQRQLIDLGFMDKATGYYGTETIEAVKAFQEKNGLAVDGKTGQETLDLLYSPNAELSDSKVKKEVSRANILKMIEVAENQMGDPYVWGAQGPNSFDCSGLVYYCLNQAGSSRGRYNAAGYSQVSDWEKITSMDDLEIGDLLFFSTNGKKVGHTGIYVGGGEMIDASSANGKVVRRDCKTDFWTSNFVVARRPW